MLTFNALNFLIIDEKLKLINKLTKLPKNFIHVINNVNKSLVLQHKIKSFKIIRYDLIIKKLLTLNT